MSKHSPLPYHFYVNVDGKYLGEGVGITKGIWHGVYGREYQLLLGHVMLETGANWSGLPLHAISTTNDFSLGHEVLMPWKVMGEEIDVVHMHYLEGLMVRGRDVDDGRHTGVVVDWKDGYSRYQQEHKPLNLIHLSNGQFALLPNNYCVFKDKHFTLPDMDVLKKYRRGESIYWE